MGVAAVAAYSVECRQCGKPIFTRARPGNTIRCRACGHAQRARPQPSQPAGVIPLPRTAATAWEPSSQPRRAYETTEPCPGCAGPLIAGRRGTWRVCPGCGHAVTPAAVAAPYTRGERAPQRQVISQQERDLAALALAQRKGIMLTQLAKLAADDRLAEDSRPVIEWFQDEVKAARSGNRLDELAALLPQAGIRRRHFWQREPAAIDAPAWDDQDGYDGDADGDGSFGEDEDLDDEEDYPHASPAPALPAELTWADALEICGWRLSSTVGGCQVIEAGQWCGAETAHHISGPRHIRDAWICARHYQVLCRVLMSARRPA